MAAAHKTLSRSSLWSPVAAKGTSSASAAARIKTRKAAAAAEAFRKESDFKLTASRYKTWGKNQNFLLLLEWMDDQW